jgi:AAA ATPase domain
VSLMPFVGREREAAYVRSELEAGRSVVLTGIWGIGRTSLAERVAQEMAREWLFVFADFDRGPGAVWRDLFAAIFPRAEARLRNQAKPMKWMRFRVSTRRLEDPRRHVVVLDNVARLSSPGLDVVRRLRERFQVVAVTEDFLPDQAKEALASALWARPAFRVGHLSRAATAAFFEECSRRHRLEWGEGEIRGLARAVDGFPLGMTEAVAAELRRRHAVRNGGPAQVERARPCERGRGHPDAGAGRLERS